MEELFEFLFGASGRINRAKYRRSLLIFCGAGLLVDCVLALEGFALSIWGFVEIGCLRGNVGPNNYGSNPLSVHAASG